MKRMPPGLRKAALTVHIAFSVGWLGAVAAYLALDVTATTSQDPLAVRSSYVAMGLIAWWIVLPAAIGSFATGLVMALGTKWGLVRHWWVVFSLILTLVAILVLLSELRTLTQLAGIASDPATSDDELLRLPGTLLHSGMGFMVLLAIAFLNVFKPKGLTRYGWRKKRQATRGIGA